MQERLKRRKKKPEEQPADSSPAPLQPAYFEKPVSDEAMPAAAPELPTAEPVRNESPEIPASEPEKSAAPRHSRPVSAKRPTRRRRGRSGRGKTAAPVTASPANAAVVEASDLGGSIDTAKVIPPPQRAPKGVVVLAIGLPGSGKSSWFKRHNITPLSSDMLRSLLFDDPTEQRFQDLIFSNLRSMLKARLIARRPLNYVDTTNLTPHDRQSWIKLAKDFGYEVQAVFFDVPLEVCLERNQKRERVVNEEIMRRFAGKLKAPTFDEGFSKITVVRVKQKSSD